MWKGAVGGLQCALYLYRFFSKKKRPEIPPDPKGKPVLWIHGVSVGEIKSASLFYQKLKKRFPEHFFFVTTTTKTGQEEAKRSLQGVDRVQLLPLDLRFIIRRFAEKLRPEYFFLIESDFWPTLLEELEKVGCTNVLLSGKMSERSAKRFRRVAFFSKKLFAKFHQILVQSEEERARFFPLVLDKTRLKVTGSLKCSMKPQKIDPSFWKTKLNATLPWVTLASTHPLEETYLLEALPKNQYAFFIAPRHPERFEEVAKWLTEKGITFSRWSQGIDKAHTVILVDQMGQLPVCYTLSRLAIIGGSFVEGIGGHNILEPLFYKTPVLFGPHMWGQKVLVEEVLKARLGYQVSLETLPLICKTCFDQEEVMLGRVSLWKERSQGVLEKTFSAIFEKI